LEVREQPSDFLNASHIPDHVDDKVIEDIIMRAV
jgi:hypothetical protein